MSMKRRGFLQIFGGALAAPLLPNATFGATAKATYPVSALHAAIYHAKARVNFSVFALSQRLGVDLAQAEQIMAEMSSRGILGPLQGTTQSGRWALSKVWERPIVDAAVLRRTPQQQTSSHIDEPDAVQTNRTTTMEKFEKLSGIAAPMPLVNIDTDMIIPKVFLKTIKRSGLGVNLFDEMRFDREGNEIPDFVLNQPAYRDASILIAGDNFGCGSSREHAPWAIADFGIRCVISTSFADIFYNNCFKNGILPIVLPEAERDALMKDAENGANARIDVDLVAQTVTSPDGTVYSFEVDEFKKHCLLNGLDDIGLTMEKAASIDTYETSLTNERPWV